MALVARAPGPLEKAPALPPPEASTREKKSRVRSISPVSAAVGLLWWWKCACRPACTKGSGVEARALASMSTRSDHRVALRYCYE
jgi:hypothetical protein